MPLQLRQNFLSWEHRLERDGKQETDEVLKKTLRMKIRGICVGERYFPLEEMETEANPILCVDHHYSQKDERLDTCVLSGVYLRLNFISAVC